MRLAIDSIRYVDFNYKINDNYLVDFNINLVGMNAVVMDDANVGDECIVGALCFVKGEMQIPNRKIVVGNPAQIKGDVSDDMISEFALDDWENINVITLQAGWGYNDLEDNTQEMLNIIKRHSKPNDFSTGP